MRTVRNIAFRRIRCALVGHEWRNKAHVRVYHGFTYPNGLTDRKALGTADIRECAYCRKFERHFNWWPESMTYASLRWED